MVGGEGHRDQDRKGGACREGRGEDQDHDEDRGHGVDDGVGLLPMAQSLIDNHRAYTRQIICYWVCYSCHVTNLLL